MDSTGADLPQRTAAARSELRLVLGLVGCAALLRLIFLWYMPNVFSQEGESYSRINLMLTWLAQGRPYPDTNFGPLHTWFVYLVTLPFGSVVWPVRIAHALCGVLTVIPFFYMVRALYDSRIAAWSALYLAAFHVHLRASVTGLAEGPFILCLISGLCFAALALSERKPAWKYIALSALFFNLAGGFRFEAWLFLPPLCLMLLARSLPRAVVFGALNLIFPLTHMYMCYRLAGEGRTWADALSFARTSGVSFLQYMVHLPLSYRLLAWPRAFWLALTPPLFVLALLGLCWSLARAAAARRGRGLLLAVLPVLFLFNFAIFFYRAVKGTIDPAIYRYTLSMDLLLLPGAVWSLTELTARLRLPRRPRNAVLAALMAILICWTLVAAVQETKANEYPDDIKAVVRWIRDNGRDQMIIADHDFHPYLLVESGLPQTSFANLIWTGPLRNELDRVEYERMWREQRPSLLILNHDCNPDIGGNCVAFKFPRSDGDVFEQDGRRFTRVFQQGDYSIFRIIEPEQPAAAPQGQDEQPQG